MHRTEGPYNVLNMFANGPPGTRVEEDWLNAIQEEISNLIEERGITLKIASTDTHDQLISAIAGSFYYVDYSEVDQGLTGNDKSIKALIDIIGTNKAIIYLRHNRISAETAYVLTTNVIIPSNITLEIENGAVIDGPGALTINGPFKTGLYQVFGSSINVDFGTSFLEGTYPQWWGAVGDGTANDTAAINAAIAAFRTTKFPYGYYRITSTITIAANNKNLIGEEGSKPTILNNIAGAASDAIVFTTSDAGDSAIFGSGCSITNFIITASAAFQTDGAAIKIIKHGGFKLDGIVTLKHPFGIDLVGIRSCNLTRFRLYGTLGEALINESALLRIRAQYNDDTTYTIPWTSTFSDFIISGAYQIDYCIEINASDGLMFTNGYVVSAYDSSVQFEANAASINVSVCLFSNIYFDGVTSAAGTLTCMSLDENNGVISGIEINNCFIGNYQNDGIKLLEDTITTVSITGCSFAYIGQTAIKINSTNAHVSITGCNFRNCRSDADGGGVVSPVNSGTTIISNCIFTNDSPVAAWGIIWAGIHNLGAVTGCSFENLSGGDVGGYTLSTFNDEYKQIGNVTDGVDGIRDIFGSAYVTVGIHSGPTLVSGSGTPEGNFAAPIGSIYMRTEGGADTSIYVKESGIGDVGWIAK